MSSVNKCAVPGCKKHGYHRLPKDEIRRALWISAIQHGNRFIKLTQISRICSAHFQVADFSLTPSFWHNYQTARRYLKRTAVPSLFPWNTTCQEQQLSSTQIASLFPCNITSRKPELSSTQEQPSSSAQGQDPPVPTKLLKTYGRNPPIAFVEEQHFMVIEETNTIEDPLESSESVSSESLKSSESVSLESLKSSESVSLESFFDDINSGDFVEDHIIGLDIEDGGEIFSEQQLLHKSVQTIEHDNIANKLFPDKQLHDQSVQTDNPKKNPFSIYHHKDDNESIHFHTGLENFEKMMLVFYSLGPNVHNLNYFYGKPPQMIDTLEQFFITLIILRRHRTFKEITKMFKITLKQVQSIFITWIRFMSLQWKNLDLWIDKERVRASMPLDFCEKYPETRIILDATEFPIKKPKLPLAQQVTFSLYKNRNTVKVLIGITPCGMISYVSPAYGGSASDRQIIERSSILGRFDYNDEIMVDKGLNMQGIFMPYGVKVNMPAFFKKENQIAPATLTSTRNVASKCVHVERIIRMLKTYKILKEPMNQTETLLSSDIVLICAMLVNFRSINKNA